MYQRPKYNLSPAANRLPSSTTGSPTTNASCNGRRSPSPGDWTGPGFLRWGRLGGTISTPLLQDPPPHSEPESDEAFVEESGIKVFEPCPLATSADDDGEDDESEQDAEDEDPLYELDVLDDTIVEDDEEEEADSEKEDNHDSEEVKKKTCAEHSKHTKGGRKSSVKITEAEREKLKELMKALENRDTQSHSVKTAETNNETLLTKVKSPPDSNINNDQLEKIAPAPSHPPLLPTLQTLCSSTGGNYTADIPCQTGNNSGISDCGGNRSDRLQSSSCHGSIRPQVSSVVNIISEGGTKSASCSETPTSVKHSIPSGVSAPQLAIPVKVLSCGNRAEGDTPRKAVVVSNGSSQVVNADPVLAQMNGASALTSSVSYRTMVAQTQPAIGSRVASPSSQKSLQAAFSQPGNECRSLQVSVGRCAPMANHPHRMHVPLPVLPNTSAQDASLTRRPGRLTMPLRPSVPKHIFTIRKVAEPEVPVRKSNASTDSLTSELKSQTEANHQAGKQVKSGQPSLWLKRQSDSVAAAAGGKSQSSAEANVQEGVASPTTSHPQDQDGPGGTPTSFRQRAGTWSMANSRKMKMRLEKEKEEAAQFRQRRKSGNDLTSSSGKKETHGIFDSFRPRSKSDAKAILQARQRRKSGDDILSSSTKEKEKEKKKDTGILEVFRPRSKSDASRLTKKPNIMSSVKHAVQHTLVSPSTTARTGRRSGDATPVEQPKSDVYHTWHAGSQKTSPLGRVWELFKSHKTDGAEERHGRKAKHEKGALIRRHSMETEKSKHGSGNVGYYVRGEDPNQAAILFRDCRGLPTAAPFLENVRRSELEEDESQIFVKFFKYHHTYDLIPTSAKLVVFDTRLVVKKAFYALVYNGVRAAPLWDSAQQQFVGMLTITDFIRILQAFYQTGNKMEELEDHKLETWRTFLKDEGRPLISIGPDESLYSAIESLIDHRIHRLPVIEPKTGNVLYIITHKRILKFLFVYISKLPQPSVLQRPLRELNMGTFKEIETAREDTLIIEALNKFVERRVSALPIVDADGKLIDIYAKFDVINLAAERTYHSLDVTLKEANKYRNEWFEGVHKCTLDETLGVIMDRIVRAEVHRLVVVNDMDKVIGVISLSDILKELVLKPGAEAVDAITRPVGHMESELSTEETLASLSPLTPSGDTTNDDPPSEPLKSTPSDVTWKSDEIMLDQDSSTEKIGPFVMIDELPPVSLGQGEGIPITT